MRAERKREVAREIAGEQVERREQERAHDEALKKGHRLAARKESAHHVFHEDERQDHVD